MWAKMTLLCGLVLRLFDSSGDCSFTAYKQGVSLLGGKDGSVLRSPPECLDVQIVTRGIDIDKDA